MLHKFLTDNRQDLIARTEVKVAKRPPPKSSKKTKALYGVPVFLTQLAAVLESESKKGSHVPGDAILASATQHGNELMRSGFTVDSVVHTYGDVCQAVTELAQEKSFAISTDEFHTLNRALDDAIAGAVTEYGRQREEDIAVGETERLGLAFEQRSLLSSGMLAWEMLKNGSVGVGGSTGAVLTRSLEGLRNLNNRSSSAPPIPDGASMVK